MYRQWVGISTIAAVLQRKCSMRWGTITFYPNMYVALVGPAGKCRKGTAMSPGAAMLKDLGVKLAAEAITREALIRELKETTNTVVDPLTGVIYMHSSLTIYSQELTVFLGYNNQQLMMDLTDWFDCRDVWVYRTKHQGTDDIIGVFVNLIGATTPELLQSTLPMNAIGGGLTSRMIFVFEKEKGKSVATPFLSEEAKRLEKALRLDLERIMMMSGEFKVTEEFLGKYVEWYTFFDQQQHELIDPRFAAYFERKPTHLMKLCMIVNASRTSRMVIEGEDFDRALAIIDRTEKNMQYTFAGVGRSQAAPLMNQVLAVLGTRKKITLAELSRMFYRDASAKDMEAVIQTLDSMRVIRRVFNGEEVIIEYLGWKGGKIYGDTTDS